MLRKKRKASKRRNPPDEVAVSQQQDTVRGNDDRFNPAQNDKGHRLWTIVDLPGGQVYWYKY